MESEEREEDDINPFLSLGDADLFYDRPSPPSRAVRRDWGIPTFQDQVDRGIKTFTLSKDGSNEGVTITLEHRKFSTGSDLWDSALVLAHNLEKLVMDIPNKTVLELGSGTGAVGLFCSRCLGAKKVILTDLPENLALLEKNRSLNAISEDKVAIAALDWTSKDLPEIIVESDIDLVIGSDLFLPFARFLLEPLAKKIASILELRPSSVVILVYEERFDCSDFFKHAESLGLSVVCVDDNMLNPVYRDAGRIHVLRVSQDS